MCYDFTENVVSTEQNIKSLPAQVPKDVPDTTPVPMDIELPELPFLKMDPINNNIFMDTPDIGAIDEICAMEDINLDNCKNGFDPSVLDVLDMDHTTGISTKKNGMKKSKKVKRAKVIIIDFDFYGQKENMAMKISMNDDFESSDEEFENDVPCKMDELTLPNSNTDSDVVEKLKSACNLCQYQATKGWKQLTKHYVRKHPKCEIPISRLAKDQNPFYLSQNPFSPEITESLTGLMIKSLCPICDEVYCMCSEKWLTHFISHTGKEKECSFNRLFLLMSASLIFNR